MERHEEEGEDLELRVEFKYDAWGNRLEKKVDADGDEDWDTTQRYVYDGWKTGPQRSFVGQENFDVWADLDGSNNLTTRYVRGDAIDALFARIGSGGTAYWYTTDRLGSIREVLDSTGTVKDALTYDGFGNITAETDSNFRGRYAWTGREIDAEIELQYNRARYYDAKIGRWTSQDPLGFEAGDSNLYRYVSNRHLDHSDPSGLDATMPGIDFRQLRATISMADVLQLIGYSPTSARGSQWRGPCPCHGSSFEKSAVFSVNVAKNTFRCFKCGAAGNHLDLWALLTKKSLFQVALDLCDRLHRDVPWLNAEQRRGTRTQGG